MCLVSSCFKLFVNDQETQTMQAKEAICSCLKRTHRAQGAHIFHQGQAATNIYIVRAGKVEVRVDDEPVMVNGDYDCFGENGVLGLSVTDSSGTRTRTAVALTACELVKLSTEDLLQLVATHKSLQKSIQVHNTTKARSPIPKP